MAEKTTQTSATAQKAVSEKSTETGKHAYPNLPHIEGKILTEIMDKLQEMKEESVRMVNQHVKEDLKQREGGKDVGDDLDQASNEREREFSFILHQRHLRRLKQIEEAFERAEDGTYGLCEGTDEPINPRRLLIMPLARYSLEYQAHQEKILGRSPEDTLNYDDESLMGDD